ncbi:sugar ABC transporter substrate-binding protein [Celeribacter indicus]|uniref:ABC transporter substrate-binding protein n=1 Tax=Celeribacter indicus TaxID=1208324 RepID=A0A0B5E6Q1_9RHOB|nr:sugar ABC transporter substrate-binding protein [Celeribacter indicus]AJE49125.1 ABC transporter substrate-binding protein [Celeribacter indicus]SDX17068.1 monosaccharide ABC transporter substrate-binding protein, CUT2 family [Celeribacter indicus]
MKFTASLAGALALGLATGPALAQQEMTSQTRDAYLAAVEGKRVVYIPMSMTTDLVLTWHAFLKRQADELGYTLDVRDPNWSAEAGARALTQAIGEQPDLIVLQNPDIQAYARLIQRATKAGIKVVQLNMESLTQSDAYVGADWVGIGRRAGEAVAERCSGGNGPSNKVAVVSGVPTAPVDLFQLKGFRDALAEAGSDVEIVSEQAAGYDPSKARAITASVLQQHEDLCAVFGVWDGQDSGIGAAVKEAGVADQVFVVTSGGGASTSCERVEDGSFDMFIEYDARMQGQALNTLVSAFLQDDAPAGEKKLVYYSPNFVVTPETLTPSSCFTVGAGE